MNKDEILAELTDNSDYIRETYGVTQIGLFGSFELETNKENSDIDLLVDFKKGHKDLFNLIRLKNYLEDLFGREVDLVTKKALKDRLKDKILNQVEYVE